ncbi:MAG: hypothetical protein ACI8RD_007498 [Bacillariaceae sp.]|jgi:hypothetical protein
MYLYDQSTIHLRYSIHATMKFPLTLINDYSAVTPEQLESNLKSEKIAEKLIQDPELLTEIMEKTRMDSEEYWSERSMLAWN